LLLSDLADALLVEITPLTRGPSIFLPSLGSPRHLPVRARDVDLSDCGASAWCYSALVNLDNYNGWRLESTKENYAGGETYLRSLHN
jgi:hypothetical protein